MKNISFVILICLLLPGCTTVHNRREPFVSFSGKELPLLRPATVEEYVYTSFLGSSSELGALWEDGKPTDLVQDDRLFTKPARVVKKTYGSSYSFYPLKDYADRRYYLSDSGFVRSEIDGVHFLGPVQVYDLPQGTPVTITRSYTFNGIDSVCHRSDGTVALPGTGKTVKFTCLLGCGEYIGRAPWEDASVPEKRFVGWSGKEYN